MPDLTVGRRVYGGSEYSFGQMEPGDYGIGPDGGWWLRAPNGDRGKLDLTKHAVTEHEDGTITVSPSTAFLAEQQVTPNDGCADCIAREHDFGAVNFDNWPGWHGWLEHGNWRAA